MEIILHDNWNHLIEYYGQPVLRFEPHGKRTGKEEDRHDIPVEVAIFNLPEGYFAQFIVFARYDLKKDEWYANTGERLAIRELLRQIKEKDETCENCDFYENI